MSREHRSDTQAPIERAVLGHLLRAKDLRPWAEARAAIPEGLHSALMDRDHRLMALGADIAAETAGTTDCDATLHALMGISLGDAMDRLMGQVRPKQPRAPDYAESAAAAIAAARIYEMVGHASASGFAANLATLRQLRDGRRLAEFLSEQAQIAQGATGDRLSRCLERVAEYAGDLRMGGSRAATQDAGDALEAGVIEGDAIARDRASGRQEARWGVPQLDPVVPLHPGRMIVLAARPGVGKTSLASQAACATAATCGRAGVLFLSLEQSAADLACLLAGRELGIPSERIRMGRLTDEQRPRVRALVDEWRGHGALRFRDLSCGPCTCHDLAAAVRLACLGGNRPELVVVDYLGLMAPTNPRHTEYERISEATRAIKILSSECRVPILACAQLNRESERGKSRAPQLADLRGSGSIEQDADAVVFIHREVEDDQRHVLRHLIVAKNRRGPCGRIEVSFDRETQAFSELRAPQQQRTPRPADADARAEAAGRAWVE